MKGSMDRQHADRDEVLKDIAALQAHRRARLEFNHRIFEASADKSVEVATALRSDALYQVAEFFFLLQGFGIASPEAMEGLIERHNTYLSTLLDDQQKLSRMGLTKERVLNAIFDGETKPRVLRLWSEQSGTIDQSSLGRFLVAVMSDETARKILVACGKAGFLHRETSVYRLVLVRSTGVMERIYGQGLRDVRLAIQALAGEAAGGMPLERPSKEKSARQKHSSAAPVRGRSKQIGERQRRGNAVS